MRNSNSEISFYVDSIIVETILRDERLVKQAEVGGMVAALTDKVKNYVGGHINQDDKLGSLINLLGPGVISVAFASMDLGWLGALIGLSMRVFNINVKNIISSIWGKIKSVATGDKPVSSSQVDSFVQEAVQENYKPATQEEADQAAKATQTKSSKLIKDAKFVKLAMISYKSGTLKKEAGFFEMFSARKTKTASILTRVLSWIFKVALASAGLMVAGDVVNKFLNRPNALDGTLQKGAPTDQSQGVVPANVTKQKKFPVKPGYAPEKYNTGDSLWMERVTNNPSSIEEMLVNFAKTVYDGLDGKENDIRSSPAFQVVKDRIVQYNHASPESPMIWLPRYFGSKKQIVDYFIDDVADRTT